MEERALRSLRRGDLKDALNALGAIAQAFPDDAGVAERRSQIEASLLPDELGSSKVFSQPEPSGVYSNPAQHAEALASRGDFVGAIAVYRTLASSSELVRDRLAELLQLAQAKAHRPALARQQVLEHLLERIGSRRR